LATNTQVTGAIEFPAPSARTVDVIGDVWIPLILREAFYGATRFEQFHTGLGISRNILTDRLNRLVDDGILQRRPYQTNPVRFDYELTDMGFELFGVLLAMLGWGDKWLDANNGPPLSLVHTDCGHHTEPVVVCSHCHEPLDATNVEADIGPGFPDALTGHPEVERRFPTRLLADRRAADASGAAQSRNL
jgi:DNA-binding HxlR family transcriptional regulator